MSKRIRLLAEREAPDQRLLRVEIRISGPTGLVTSAEALAPWTGSPLGNCVADAIREARFRKCEKETVGVVFPVLVAG
jgi:hypothetical protein